jgi:pSer/pThr/pTyr-binding forkhead associated (FHA) protein
MSGPIVFALRALLAIILYAFLAWALFTFWNTIKQQGDLLISRKLPPISLSIRDGDADPKLRHFYMAEITIGRNSACECQVSKDSVSSRHARLSYHHGQWWLEDLDSTNGTYINGEKLTVPTVVISGDDVRCGETHLGIIITADKNESSSQRLSENVKG